MGLKTKMYKGLKITCVVFYAAMEACSPSRGPEKNVLAHM